MRKCLNGNDYQSLKDNNKPVSSVFSRGRSKLGTSRHSCERPKADGSQKDEVPNVGIRLKNHKWTYFKEIINPITHRNAQPQPLDSVKCLPVTFLISTASKIQLKWVTIKRYSS
jgi:hypothetical protein